MKVVFDIEANSLINPRDVWCIVCRELETNKLHIFREVTRDAAERDRFLDLARKVGLWIGHNCLEYDLPVLERLCSLRVHPDACIDTLILSRLTDYSRSSGHSLEAYGEEFGIEKNLFSDFTKYSKELEERCVRDTEIGTRVYNKFSTILGMPEWHSSIRMEHEFQHLVNQLHNNGFCFNTRKASSLLEKVTQELGGLDARISEAFPVRSELVKEYTPRLTKYGTISKVSVPRGDQDLSPYQEGATFSQLRWRQFNPSSHKQLIEVLARAGWRPIDKTQTHINTERELNHLKYKKQKSTEVDLAIKLCKDKLEELGKTGWKINETNLGTLPDNAPEPARLLAKRILLESRRRTLTEWCGLVHPDGRIRGKFLGIGAWTHRMAHQAPNTANIPNEFETSGKVKLLGKEMRQLWCAPKGRLLVGVDAEGIQLRIFAHYIDDKEFTDALVRGSKADKTDPHSLNQRILGDRCKSRQAAKRFVYALLLGAGMGKLAQILECDVSEARQALDKLLERYTDFATLKQQTIPVDARKGYFVGLDGRRVKLPGDTQSERSHLCMSGYLQNGEAIVMKMATLRWWQEAEKLGGKLVNFVHDEWQTEAPNNMATCLQIADLQATSLRLVGEELGLKCPLAGSYWNDDHQDYTIGTNWYQTH